MTWAFTVAGPCATKGSVRSFPAVDKQGRAKMRNGKPVIIVKADNDALRSWSGVVRMAAWAAGVKQQPAEVAVAVHVEVVRGMKSAKAQAAPAVTRPDIDKHLRAVLDALTGVAYVDDSQVVDGRCWKANGPVACTTVTVTVLDPGQRFRV